MNAAMDRRKFIAISAAAAGLSALPFGSHNKASGAHLVEWRGTCLGAVATLRVHHPDESAARRSCPPGRGRGGPSGRCVQPLPRRVRPMSAQSPRRFGVSSERAVGYASGLQPLLGDHRRRFRPTVQALWRCYAESFSTKGDAPTTTEREVALELVGWRQVRFDRDRVVLGRPGMGLTLNGIAQGYITDRVLEQLRSSGIASCLVDMGEIRTLGENANGDPLERRHRGRLRQDVDFDFSAQQGRGDVRRVWNPVRRARNL